ncbi:MAG: GNAT family N-acetyltransferase [Acidimicrobiales bacterium]
MVNVRPLADRDAPAVAARVLASLRADAALNSMVNGDAAADDVLDALASVASSVWVATSPDVVGHLHAALLSDDVFGSGAWVAPDGVSFDDPEVLAELYATAGASWISLGAREHYAWVLDHPERTSAWLDLGFARMHQRGVRALAGLGSAPVPSGLRIRVGGLDDLDAACVLSAELDRAQAQGPSFSSMPDASVDRSELAEALADPDVTHYLVERGSEPVAQCLTFALASRRGSFARTVHLSAVSVREGERARGVGTALVDHALGAARRRGFDYAETNWRVTNRRAVRFWTGYGFAPTYVRLHRTIAD